MMSKREYAPSLGTSDAEGTRAKRRRGAAAASSDGDVTLPDPAIHEARPSVERGNANDVVKEQGMKLWQAVKDAVNKEDRSLSLNFLRKPSKRQYPDYYQLIQRPIALDDIKKQLEHGDYPSLEAVKQDFELCFNNAKNYNMKDSEIWKDAKDLLKLINKAYNKIAPPGDDDENGDGDSDKKAKSKPPNLNRLIKSRLQKLVDKSNSSGRVLSVEFMELPSKKDWPLYYKEIKRPQCLENIFKRIKRKEYHTSAEFSADVELVFANAMTFNQEHTGIWEDARTLRDYFRLLMSDLPHPYALPEYTKPSNGKIKIKMPSATQPSSSAPAPNAQPDPPPTSFLLRVPRANASGNSKPSPAPTPVLPTVPLPTAPAVPPATPPVPPPVELPPDQPSIPPQSYTNTTFSHYPNASYIPPAPISTGVIPTSSTSNSMPNSLPSASRSPAAPSPHPSHQLKTVRFETRPRGRTFHLDYRDGVKTWAMRLGSNETSLHVSQVTFLGDEEEESSGEEHEQEMEGKHEEDEEDDPSPDIPVKLERKKGKGKGRGRPKGSTKAVIAKAKVVAAKKKAEKIGKIQLKLNGTVIQDKEDQEGSWVVPLAIGTNTVEVGETGGVIWKSYVERLEHVY